jgi:hypothetical protein
MWLEDRIILVLFGHNRLKVLVHEIRIIVVGGVLLCE